MTLDELEHLDRDATPAPWAEFCESGEWWVSQTDEHGDDHVFVCESDIGAWRGQPDIDLAVAARNALPALLRVARAAQRHKDAEFFYEALQEALQTPGEHVDQGRAAATVQEHIDARLALWAALAELAS